MPGDPSFQGEARCALRVVEGALFVVSGVMGVEVGTTRGWKRADELGLSRVLFVNMLDRERADFFRTLGALQSQLSERCVAVHLPIGSEHELTGIVDVLHMCAYTSPDGAQGGRAGPDPGRDGRPRPEYREKLLDEVVADRRGADGALPGRRRSSASRRSRTRSRTPSRAASVFPVACGVATKNLGTHALLDLIVEGVPVAGEEGRADDIEGAETAAFVFKTIADPFAGRINLFRVLEGSVRPDATLVNARAQAKERMGPLLSSRARSTRGRGVRARRHRRGREAEGGADRRPAARQASRDRRARRSASPSP